MTTFFRNLFSPSKAPPKPPKGHADDEKADAPKDPEDVFPVTPDRRLSLSKSGKMKRKSYTRQASVTEKGFFDNPKNAGQKNDDVSPDDNIDDIVRDMLETVETTKI